MDTTKHTGDTDLIIEELTETLNPKLRDIAHRHFGGIDDVLLPKISTLIHQKPQQVEQIIGETNPKPKPDSNKQNPILPIIDEVIQLPEKIDTKKLKTGKSTFIFTLRTGARENKKTLIYDGLSSKKTDDGIPCIRMKSEDGKYYIWNGVVNPPEKIMFGMGTIVEMPDNNGKIKQHRKYHIVIDGIKSIELQTLKEVNSKASWFSTFGSKHKK